MGETLYVCRQKWREERRPSKILWREKQLFHRKKEVFFPPRHRGRYSLFMGEISKYTPTFSGKGGDVSDILRKSYGLRKEEEKKKNLREIFMEKTAHACFPEFLARKLNGGKTQRKIIKQSENIWKCVWKRNSFWSFYLPFWFRFSSSAGAGTTFAWTMTWGTP